MKRQPKRRFRCSESRKRRRRRKRIHTEEQRNGDGTEKRAHSTRTACKAGRQCEPTNDEHTNARLNLSLVRVLVVGRPRAPLRGDRVECAPPFRLRYSVSPCFTVISAHFRDLSDPPP